MRRRLARTVRLFGQDIVLVFVELMAVLVTLFLILSPAFSLAVGTLWGIVFGSIRLVYELILEIFSYF